MGAVAAGMVISTGIKLSLTLRHNPMGLPACVFFTALGFAAIALLRWPLVGVLLGVGGAAIALAWHRLGPAR
jgi:chromate transporter